ncbi:hypothetical protein P7E02_19395 [Enterococcus hulanensis]|uniref:hypothetical protein n=1 Tax=Enterococcus hulanensis TaxID=2559929 RepID=UPI0028903499|nr:hypothetical protein [Enterococcus hulanensis]MDT2662054.1 hypothetical protein [Enterococcus hulanensis]
MKKILQSFLLVLIGILFLVVGTESQAADKTVTVNRFLTLVYSDKKEEAIPIKNASVKILYYDAQGKRQILRDDLTSDNNGEVKNVTVNVPEEITRIYFEYWLSRPETGNIVNAKGITYRPITSWPIPENRTIDVTSTRFFVNSSHEDSKEYNYQSIKVWNLYYAMVNETRESLQLALDNFHQLKTDFNYEIKPITVLYENEHKRTDAAGFCSMSSDLGEVKKGTPYLCIPHIDAMKTYTRVQHDEWFNVNLSHEWQHWTMYLSIGKLVGGGYNGFTGNANEAMSYKEGWTVFHANRYPYGYNWNWKLDNSVQIGNGNYANCFGRSTIWTANSVLRDIYDRESPREPEDQYDIARDWMPDVASKGDDYRMKLSNGLMFITMAKSKAKTLAEYIQYMKANGMVKNTAQFDAILKLNGLDANGNYTLGPVN